MTARQCAKWTPIGFLDVEQASPQSLALYRAYMDEKTSVLSHVPLRSCLRERQAVANSGSECPPGLSGEAHARMGLADA
jgi:hypothetical protein